jgi:hypothetical protein
MLNSVLGKMGHIKNSFIYKNPTQSGAIVEQHRQLVQLITYIEYLTLLSFLIYHFISILIA